MRNMREEKAQINGKGVRFSRTKKQKTSKSTEKDGKLWKMNFNDISLCFISSELNDLISYIFINKIISMK